MSEKIGDAAQRLFTIHPDDDGIRVDRWIKRHMADVPFNLVSRWARTGQLRIDGKRAEPGDRVAAGQQLRLPPKDVQQVAVKAARPAAAPKRLGPPLTEDEIEFAQSLVIYKDEHAIVINKPPGLATQGGTKTTDHVDRLLDALCFDLPHRPKLVHRLDKDTSGVLLVARTPRAAGFFAKSFSSRTARKVYWAIIAEVPSIEDGIIELPLSKQPGTGGEKMHVDNKEGAPAKTRYRVIDIAGNRAAWVELQPYTGRTHQLRVHMAAIGHPIIGDGKYGGPEAFLTGTISRKMHLHARRLQIDSPGGGQIDVIAEPPTHFTDSIKQLGFDLADGDKLVFDEIKFMDTPEGKRKAVTQQAKAARKERKGERRGRGGPEKRGSDRGGPAKKNSDRSGGRGKR
ncbi:RluA family pseudouridine synthase [Aquisediminimonas sediminicola]|uniref:RluA family pseudouridine synthase n=1 Tax=Alteraquisediminimonas sediminicola TaxID=2676787 RepID=UPI001C8E2522|nr:RluA family pseudouridine synthase [Aquisediminimonas sediminicola]